ncbi:aspartic proteinase nepenthesin-2 [Phtheirospermum japonicum]|uniref:Aspartic proteinase nepenthesin-2 n=1 Tax=Phtheirospermum japonicum TaxID=374723 RepID=A0A830CYP3_9LAMI|nr:aspartic proteinase nepenthesin-2 [Phtheirospermum japonicum]
MTEPLTEIPDGFIMSLTLGTPPQVIQKIFFDTGSDLFWVPCGKMSFTCIGCPHYKRDLSTILNPMSSSSSIRESCMSPLCVNLHSAENYYDTCIAAGCSLDSIHNKTCMRLCPAFAYTYAYGVVAGHLVIEILDTHQAKNLGNPNITFGCVSSTVIEPTGIVGFGRGPLSLPSQLGFLSKGFSHCFLSFDFSSNPNISCPLVLGDIATSSKEHFQFTQMLYNPVYPYFYYIGLKGVTVGDTTIQAPVSLSEFNSSGDGGFLMDSGTTYTHLPEPFYSQLLSTLKSVIKYPRAEDVEDGSWSDLCYDMPIRKNNSQPDGLPSVTFHFLNNVSLTLAQGTYFYKMARPKGSTQVQCLMFQQMDDERGPGGVFGSFQQQNVEVVYDLEKERIGFQTTDCASLAKTHGLHRT